MKTYVPTINYKKWDTERLHQKCIRICNMRMKGKLYREIEERLNVKRSLIEKVVWDMYLQGIDIPKKIKREMAERKLATIKRKSKDTKAESHREKYQWDKSALYQGPPRLVVDTEAIERRCNCTPRWLKD